MGCGDRYGAYCFHTIRQFLYTCLSGVGYDGVGAACSSPRSSPRSSRDLPVHISGIGGGGTDCGESSGEHDTQGQGQGQGQGEGFLGVVKNLDGRNFWKIKVGASKHMAKWKPFVKALE